MKQKTLKNSDQKAPEFLQNINPKAKILLKANRLCKVIRVFYSAVRTLGK